MRRSPRGAEAVSGPTAGPAVESGAAAGAEPDADPGTAGQTPRAPTPHVLAERGGTFGLTAGVLDPEDDPDEVHPPGDTGAPGRDEPGDGGPGWTGEEPAGQGRLTDDPQTERGLRGLVGAGSSQVSLAAALRARDASRPTEADLAAAEAELLIVRRGWVPREDLPPRGPRR
jgi:hypothetical protein